MFLLSAVAPWKRVLFPHQRFSVMLRLWVAPLATSRNAETLYRDRRCRHHCSQPGPWKGLAFPACIQHVWVSDFFPPSDVTAPLQPCPWLSCLWCWGPSPWRFHANLKIRRPSFWLIGCLMALRRESQCFFHFDIFCLFTMLGLGAPPHSTQPLKDSNPYNQLHFNQKKKKKTSFLCWPWRHTTQSLGLEPWAQLHLRPWVPAVLVPQFLSQDTYW